MGTKFLATKVRNTCVVMEHLLRSRGFRRNIMQNNAAKMYQWGIFRCRVTKPTRITGGAYLVFAGARGLIFLDTKIYLGFSEKWCFGEVPMGCKQQKWGGNGGRESCIIKGFKQPGWGFWSFQPGKPWKLSSKIWRLKSFFWDLKIGVVYQEYGDFLSHRSLLGQVSEFLS